MSTPTPTTKVVVTTESRLTGAGEAVARAEDGRVLCVAGAAPDEEVEVNGVRILGPIDLPSRVATDASRMYARNLQELVGRWRIDDGLTVNLDDDVAGPATITSGGRIINPRTRVAMGLEEETT